jgi:hypothetical protein
MLLFDTRLLETMVEAILWETMVQVWLRIGNIFKFIEVTEFPIDLLMMNWFWQIMVNNHSSHLITVVLEWSGYEGKYILIP